MKERKERKKGRKEGRKEERKKRKEREFLKKKKSSSNQPYDFKN